MDKKRNISLALISLVATSMFIGCGGGSSYGGGSSGGTSGGNNNGQLVDSAVFGVNYKCGDGSTGITKKDGNFTCSSFPITFKIGELKLGSINKINPLDRVVSPQDLAGVSRNDLNDAKVLAIARLLQSVDKDHNPDNGIEIDNKIRESFKKSINFSKDKLNSYVNDINDSHYVLVSEDKALQHLKKSFSSKQNYLFYGNVDPKGLGSLKSARLFGSNALDVNTSINPVLSTSLTYKNGNYTNLYVSKLSYVADGKAYMVNMNASNANPTPVQNSKDDNLTSPRYHTINYLGVKQYLTAKSGAKNLLITPDMKSGDNPLDIGSKSFFTITYNSYGSAIDGYLFYDSSTKKVQKCTTDLSSCIDIDIPNVGSRDFKGDMPGTTYSAFLVHGKIYKYDKSNDSTEEIDMPNGVSIASGHGTTSIGGNSLYFIGSDHNIYRTNFKTNQISKITKEANEDVGRIKGFTKNWVLYGSDVLLLATKKDSDSDTAIKLVENTTTKGYKYVNYPMADSFLFEPYSLDTSKKITKFKACTFKDSNGDIECKDNSFWATVVFKKSGKLSHEATLEYAPYAYVRVDNTDAYGGGVLKAINPKHPLEDGIKLGTVKNYNFQTFLSGYRYIKQNIDNNGNIVLYAKNDTNFHVDAFSMNLLKENSLKQLTDLNPGDDIHKGRDHCHGRVCMICHSFAGGKIYNDKNRSAYGYRVRLEFEDGTSVDANISKGKSENFSLPLTKIKGNFKALILDSNGTVVNHSSNYYHQGIKAANCNYCHARDILRSDAPALIHN